MKLATLAALGFVAAFSGCVAESGESPDDIEVRATQAALSASPRSDLWRLYAQARFDAVKGATAVTLDTRDPFATPDPRILEDRYLAVFVYRDRGDGIRDALAMLRGTQIGPGGGCIHFEAPAAVGDRLFISAVVKLAGDKGAVVGVVPDGTTVF